ncbi:MAG: hypothetical protein KAR19_08785 [Bacteroidales bacterium]|nr:hypothetical protein [Bacteroidales bacterium]
MSEETAEYVRSGIITRCKSLKDFSGYSIERYLEDEQIEYRSVTQWNYNIIHTSRDPSKRKDF